jgi:hypothetical protein
VGAGLLVVVVSAKGSPGVSTTCLGLAATWPHGWSPVLVEADASGGDVGIWHGLDAEPGLVGLAAASRRTGRDDLVWEHTQQLPGGLPVVIAPAGADQASAAVDVLSGCPDLGFLTSAAPRPDPDPDDGPADVRPDGAAATGIDAGPAGGAGGGAAGAVGAGRAVVVADVGRLPSRVSRTTRVGRVLAAADIVLLVTGTDAAGVVHAAAAAETLNGLGPVDAPADRVRLLLADRGPYRPGEVTAALGLPVAGSLPKDARTAAALAGRSTWGPVRPSRSALLRALAGIAQDLAVEHRTGPEPVPAALGRGAPGTDHSPRTGGTLRDRDRSGPVASGPDRGRPGRAAPGHDRAGRGPVSGDPVGEVRR